MTEEEKENEEENLWEETSPDEPPKELNAELQQEVDKREIEMLFKGLLVSRYFGRDKKGNIIPSIFYPESVSRDLQKIKSIIVMRDNLDIYIYNEENGKYEPNGKQLLRELIHKILGELYREPRAKQVIESITSSIVVKDRNDLNPPLHLIGFENGILDISTFPYKRLPHSPKYFFTEFLAIEHNPTATCKEWEKFLNSSYRPADIIFLQQWVGSCLLREIKPPNWKAVMLHGPTKTGKSTFIHVLNALFGSSAVNVPLHSFKDKFERVRFYGRLLNAHADIGSTELHDTSAFKTTVAGDTISARTLYCPSFDFSPYPKHIFSCNDMPPTWDDSGAFFERWRLVIVNLEQFLDTNPNQDKKLLTKLTTKEELSGILNWALEGLQKFLKQGYYSQCPDKEETRRLWQLFSNPQGAFMYSNWVKFVSEHSETKENLYQHFVKFCEGKGITPWSKARFGRALRKHFVAKGYLTESRETQKDGKQVPCWRGIKLIPQTPRKIKEQQEELALERERERALEQERQRVLDEAEVKA
jgi:putative DNA primase/helicase